MSSSSQRRLSPRGSVRTKVSNGSLQLVFSHGGKRRYLSLRLPDSAVNRKVAEAKAKLIESDILFDRLDPSLNKYRPQSVLAAADNLASAPQQPSLLELWEAFVEFKRPQCSPNTMVSMYLTFTRYVKRLPTHDLAHAAAIRDYVLANIPLNSGKRLITRFSACCNWAMKSGLIAENPFSGMAAEIKLPKTKKIAGFNQINPFSLDERDAIIRAIETDQFRPVSSAYKHSYYTPLVKLLFATGCRSSEASALQWRNISEDCRQITFDQAVILTENGRRIRKGLKTQSSRTFPCNDSLHKLLLSIRPESPRAEDLVFPSPKGKPTNLNNFRRRTWKPVLNGLGIPYRKLYQTRHTFITHALETGKLDAKDVAQLVGNSPEVIYQYYAGQKRELAVPEF
ncbi:MAG: tyrosine-type recombinase/integrase [Cyanobacteria bacterium P01_F01_bin.53]